MLTIQPGYQNGRLLGYPYGTIPRLILFWITSEAVRKKSRKIVLGNTLSGFMQNLDLIPSGGRWGTIPRLRNQMERLFRAKIGFEYATERCQRWSDMQIAPDGELWWDYKQPEQGNLFQSWIELGEKFYQAIVAAPVPVDMRALKALKRSPLALDLYAWAAYKTFNVTRKNQEQFISWKGLEMQLGGDYKNPRHFKAKVRTTLKKIQLVYPGLKIDEAIERDGGGLVVCPGKLSVIPRSDRICG